MTDAQPRPSTPPSDPSTLTVDDAASRYEEAGIPRTIRRVQKYCARGDLDCQKIETEFGERYVITPESVDRHIAQVLGALAAAGRAPTRPDAAGRSLLSNDNSVGSESAPAVDPARPDASGRDYQTVYLEHLQIENAFLRDQNTLLIERVRETNIISGRLQEMLTPLLVKPALPKEGGHTGVNDQSAL